MQHRRFPCRIQWHSGALIQRTIEQSRLCASSRAAQTAKDLSCARARTNNKGYFGPSRIGILLDPPRTDSPWEHGERHSHHPDASQTRQGFGIVFDGAADGIEPQIVQFGDRPAQTLTVDGNAEILGPHESDVHVGHGFRR